MYEYVGLKYVNSTRIARNERKRDHNAKPSLPDSQTDSTESSASMEVECEDGRSRRSSLAANREFVKGTSNPIRVTLASAHPALRELLHRSFVP